MASDSVISCLINCVSVCGPCGGPLLKSHGEDGQPIFNRSPDSTHDADTWDVSMSCSVGSVPTLKQPAIAALRVAPCWL